MRELRGWLPSPVALGITGLSLVVVASCARSAPTGPDSVGLSQAQASSTSIATGAADGAAASTALFKGSVTSFELTAGTFALTTADGHRLGGGYTGRADVAALGKDSTATLALHVEGVAGGTLRGEGKGAFAGEGRFRLSLNGQLSTAAGTTSKFHAVVTGTSQLACVGGGLILTLEGSGSATRFGRVEMELRHQVGSADCS